MDNKNLSTEFNSTNILLFFIRWWKQLVIVCLVAAIMAAIFSSPFFITPLFESTVIMFPAKSSSVSRAAHGGYVDFLEYGDVEDAERLLQVLESAAIRDRIVEHFDLFAHYKIPQNSQYKNTTLRAMYNGYISSSRTLYGAVEIKVRDRDPEMAANIANHISALADTIQNEIRQDRARMAYNTAVQRYENLLNEIIKTEDSLRVVMGRGVYQYETQSEMLTRQLAIDISKNNQRGIDELQEQLEFIRQSGSEFITQRSHLEQVSRSLATIQRIMEEAKADLENFVPFKFLIDDAFVAEKKVYPVRWLIVFLSTLAAGVMGTLVLMTYENLSKKNIFDHLKKG